MSFDFNGTTYRFGLEGTSNTSLIFDQVPAPPRNQPPTADAGDDRTYLAGRIVQLDGTDSFDPDGTIASYAWTQTAGPTVTLVDSTTASPTFNAPPLLAGDPDVVLTFSLVVTDNLGLRSTADTVTITVVAGLPVVVSGGPDAITGTDPFTVTVTFAKPVTGFNDLTNDVIVTNGTVSAITGGPAVYTLTIVPTGNGDISISIPAGAAQEVRTDGFVNLNSVSNVLVIGNRIVEITQEQIASFMLGRANNLATNQPGLTRFLVGEGCGSFNASATQDGSSLDGCVVLGKTWVEITSTSSGDGSYTLGTVGVHRFANPDLLFGGMIQFDYTDDPANNASGSGWLMGPYFVAKTPDQPLYFEGRLLYGQTDNEITPLGTYTDSFETERWLAQVRATGEYEVGDTTLMPLLDFTYTEDQQKAYTDSLGNTIPGQTVDLMQLSTGLDFKTPIPVETGSLELAGGISGIYSSSNGAATAPEFEDWRGRTHLGLNYDTGTGTTLSLSGFYDGLGTSYESYGASLTANIRF